MGIFIFSNLLLLSKMGRLEKNKNNNKNSSSSIMEENRQLSKESYYQRHCRLLT